MATSAPNDSEQGVLPGAEPHIAKAEEGEEGELPAHSGSVLPNGGTAYTDIYFYNASLRNEVGEAVEHMRENCENVRWMVLPGWSSLPATPVARSFSPASA